MTKKSTALAKITILPPQALSETKKLMPLENITQLSYWGDLSKREQAVLMEESLYLTAAMQVFGTARIVIGQHLYNMREILLPHRGLYGKFIKNFRWTERTAIRYVNGYESAAQALPEDTLKAIMARGVDILGYSKRNPLGKFTEAYEVMRAGGALPPTGSDPKRINSWIDNLERTQKEINNDPTKKANVRKRLEARQKDTVKDIRNSYEFRLMNSYRTVKNDYNHVSSRKKSDFIESIIGMLMSEAGIQSTKSFRPEAIPDHFKQGRGRPEGSTNKNLDDE